MFLPWEGQLDNNDLCKFKMKGTRSKLFIITIVFHFSWTIDHLVVYYYT